LTCFIWSLILYSTCRYKSTTSVATLDHNFTLYLVSLRVYFSELVVSVIL